MLFVKLSFIITFRLNFNKERKHIPKNHRCQKGSKQKKDFEKKQETMGIQ